MNKGLSISDAQYSICKGTYGGKEWSPSERQAACERYEQLTGKKINSDSLPTELWTISIGLVLVVGIITAFKRFKKLNKIKKSKK